MDRIRWWLGRKCIWLASRLLPPGTVSYRRSAPDVPGTVVGVTHAKEQ